MLKIIVMHIILIVAVRSMWDKAAGPSNIVLKNMEGTLDLCILINQPWQNIASTTIIKSIHKMLGCFPLNQVTWTD